MSSGQISTKIFIKGEKEYTEAIKNINSAQKLLKAEMKDLSATFKNAANTEDALKAKSEVLTKQIEQAQKKYETYEKAVRQAEETQKKAAENLEKMVAAHGRDSEEAKKAQEQYDLFTRKLQGYQTGLVAAKTDLTNLNNELTNNKKYLDEAQKSEDRCATSIDKLGKEAAESGEQLKTTEEALKAIASSELFKAISAGAEQIAAALGECVEAADTFEYAMSKVQSIARVEDGALAGMGDEIQDLAVKYGASANEIAEATYQAISASVDSADAIAFVEDAMTLARGGFTDTVTAVDVLTTALNAYGKEANSTEHIMNALVTVQNLGKTTVGELAENLGTVIPAAAAYNVSLDNLSAAYIQLTKNGVNTANATTYISGMLTELADSGSTVGKILKEETGQSFGQLMSSGKSLGDVIQILGETVDGDSEKFANLFGNVRAGRGALTIFNNSAEEFNKSMAAVADSTGAANEAFETMADTSEMTTQRMKAASENLKVSIGEALQPTIDSFKEAGIAVLEPLNEFVEANPEIVGAVAGVTAAVTGAATAMTAAAAAGALLKTVMGDMSGVAAILGSAAIAGGVVGLATASKSASAEVISLGRSVKDTVASMDEIAEGYNTQVASIDRYADKVKDLQKVEGELSDTQKTEMVVAVNALNKAIPELGLSIDETTGKIKNYTDALDKSIEKEVERYKLALKQEEAQKIIEKRVELDEKEALAKEKVAEAQERLNKAMAAGRDFTAEAEEVDAAQRAYGEITDSIDECNEQYDRLIATSGEASDATDEFSDSQEDAQSQVDATASKLEELREEYQKAKESALDSLESQRDAFQEMGEAARTGAEDAKVSIQTVAQGYEDQKNAIEGYAKNVQSALEFMGDNKWSQGLFSSLIQQGPDAAAELQAVLDAASGGEEDIEGLRKICNDFDGFTKIADQVATAQGAIETGYTPAIESALESNEKLIESTGEVVHAYEDGHIAFKTHAEETTETAGKIPEEAAGAVSENAQLVADAETEMLEGAETAAYAALGMDGEGGQSTVYYNLGLSVSQSFADGITGGTDSVSSAISSLCEAAVNAIDISGLSDKVSEAVSKIVGEAESKLASNVVASTARQARMEGAGGQR